MKIGILKETLFVKGNIEKRVAATPETLKKLKAMGASVFVEKDAGFAAGFADNAYEAAGATIVADFKDIVKESDIILKVNGLSLDVARDEYTGLKKDAIVLGLLDPMGNPDVCKDLVSSGASFFSLDLIPRISRAQAMDVLSSQSNLAGYRAVIEAAYRSDRAFPMMMTAAGTIAPARVLIIGAGVAGLQAIATAKRLGAIVSAFDVRAAAKEQVESLGATFIDVPEDENETLETAGGYAKEASAAYKERQSRKLHDALKKSDIVITTALIPGKKAPLLVTEEMLADMKSGSILIDLAALSGGNVAGSAPNKEVITKNGVIIMGLSNLPSHIARDASHLYARNVISFCELLLTKKDEKAHIHINLDDEIISKTLIVHQGAVRFSMPSQ